MKFNGLLNSRGFSIVELLIGLLISSILMLIIVTVFSETGHVMKVNRHSLDITEQSQFIKTLLEEDIRKAGFRGCVYTDLDQDAGIVNLTTAEQTQQSRFMNATNLNIDFYTALTGVEGGANSDSLVINFAKPMDIVVLSSNGEDEFAQTAFVADSANMGFVDEELEADSMLAVSNCYKTYVFVLTRNANTQPAAIGSDYNGNVANDQVLLFPYDGAAPNGVINQFTSFNDMSMNVAGGAPSIFSIQNVEYRVANSTVPTNDNTQSLYRLVNGEAPSEDNELILNIKEFDVMYGLDIDLDGVADRYADADSVQGNEVVSVQVKASLLINDLEKDFSTILNLRNRGL